MKIGRHHITSLVPVSILLVLFISVFVRQYHKNVKTFITLLPFEYIFFSWDNTNFRACFGHTNLRHIFHFSLKLNSWSSNSIKHSLVKTNLLMRKLLQYQIAEKMHLCFKNLRYEAIHKILVTPSQILITIWCYYVGKCFILNIELFYIWFAAWVTYNQCVYANMIV